MAEKLGYDNNLKLLIVHIDDIGLSHSTNTAAERLFNINRNFSGGIMIPCPWFPEFAEFAIENSALDLGIHITLTSEWDRYFFGGVLSADKISSLVNKYGNFYPTREEFISHSNLQNVEQEIRAQIDRAILFGIKPTHLDSHMFTMFLSKELLNLYIKIGNDYKLPVFIPLNMLNSFPDEFVNQIKENNIVVDKLFFKEKSSQKDEWAKDYIEFIDNMKPGLSEIILHPALDTDENRAIMINHCDFGSEWRQNDLDFLMSDEFTNAIERNNVKIITWRQVAETIK